MDNDTTFQKDDLKRIYKDMSDQEAYEIFKEQLGDDDMAFFYLQEKIMLNKSEAKKTV